MYKIINQIKDKKIIAIEGEPASGKTTLAKFFHEELNCNVVSIDDFYLPLNKRNETSFKKGGNNIDYQRLIKEVILKHINMQKIEYKSYDCRLNKYTDIIELTYKPILIIEGSYSLREEVIQYFDFKILMKVDLDTQLVRLKARSNYQDFLDRWIPLSKGFIQDNNIKNIVDIITEY